MPVYVQVRLPTTINGHKIKSQKVGSSYEYSQIKHISQQKNKINGESDTYSYQGYVVIFFF